MDSDKILVLDGGTVAEFDEPLSLLQNTSSSFYSMAQTTGKVTANNLYEMAKMASEKKQSFKYSLEPF